MKNTHVNPMWILVFLSMRLLCTRSQLDRLKNIWWKTFHVTVFNKCKPWRYFRILSERFSLKLQESFVPIFCDVCATCRVLNMKQCLNCTICFYPHAGLTLITPSSCFFLPLSLLFQNVTLSLSCRSISFFCLCSSWSLSSSCCRCSQSLVSCISPYFI